MRFDLGGARMRKSWLTAVVLLVGCTPAAVPTASVRPPTTAPTTLSTAAPTPTEAATPSAEPATSPTQGATSSPASGSGDDLAALFETWTPALAVFNPNEPGFQSAEEVIAQLERFSDLPFVQDEIDRYQENGLVERGGLTLGITPAASVSVDRFESEAGAAADFPARRTSCDDLTLPDTELVDVVAKRCNAPEGNDLYLIARRADLVITVRVAALPVGQPLEPVVATMVDVLRALDMSLTPLTT